MPRIFDNIEQDLLPALRETIGVSERADFCVGYFNLRGWKQIDSHIEGWAGGDGHCCRLLVGMQRLPEEELRLAMSLSDSDSGIDQGEAVRLKKKLAEEFKEQLTIGAPTNQDETALRRLAHQIREKKVRVKLFLRYPLHAKLYLLFRPDPNNPATGFLGSSNLTMAGLSRQGELNVDVLDHDACQKLAKWFEDRWKDRWCLDISDELVTIIEESWAREELIPPYHIYLKIAFHLSHEARMGLSEFTIPRDFRGKLFDFQKAAVQIAAHHINKRGGVLIGDVVGLGKTLMATAVARIFEDAGLETLIICPKNLVKMWEDYKDRYRLLARVVSTSRVMQVLPNLTRFRLVLIDESHNLRNREGKKYRAILEYIQKNDSKCILLSATPYNKTYLDLSNQLRLFVPEGDDLGIRPERLLRAMGEQEFLRRYQCPVRSLAAFEKSEHADDWRDLMRLYMVRRTRSFIKDNYAEADPASGQKYLVYEDGTKAPFPIRVPRTVTFDLKEGDPLDQYAQLYATDVVNDINSLHLPRYGMANYVAPSPSKPPTPREAATITALSRAGKRLMGFCRTNLFKRLESSGQAFLLSVERHVLRNFVFLYALENAKPLPIGTQDAEMLDSRFSDEDADDVEDPVADEEEEGEEQGSPPGRDRLELLSEDDFRARAASVYRLYESAFRKRFRWIASEHFAASLAEHLREDCARLIGIIQKCGVWEASKDRKLLALHKLLTKTHSKDKVLIFTQFADTVDYLETQLKALKLGQAEGVTGQSPDPTALAWRFSPASNEKRGDVDASQELRVLVATDVLSEGQNLQDSSIVVNYDLPWAIVRLIQRAGRVDRIGQKAEKILCYSFLPAAGVERIIRLRARVRQRLRENAEVVGTDEAFFEDDNNGQTILDLYNEKSGILDGEADTEVDLSSLAYQIWKNAIDANPALEKIVTDLPPVVYATRTHTPAPAEPEGVLLYVQTAQGNDSLAWVDKQGKSVTESLLTILKAAECEPDTPARPHHPMHHELVQAGIKLIAQEQKAVGGQLGSPSGARRRTYDRLMKIAKEAAGTFFASSELEKVIQEISRYPLQESAKDTLNRQLRLSIGDDDLVKLVISLRDENRLCQIQGEAQRQEPLIICSMGLFGEEGDSQA